MQGDVVRKGRDKRIYEARRTQFTFDTYLLIDDHRYSSQIKGEVRIAHMRIMWGLLWGCHINNGESNGKEKINPLTPKPTRNRYRIGVRPPPTATKCGISGMYTDLQIMTAVLCSLLAGVGLSQSICEVLSLGFKV